MQSQPSACVLWWPWWSWRWRPSRPCWPWARPRRPKHRRETRSGPRHSRWSSSLDGGGTGQPTPSILGRSPMTNLPPQLVTLEKYKYCLMAVLRPLEAFFRNQLSTSLPAHEGPIAEIFSDNELKGMTLHVDGYELEFEDASTTSDFDVGTAYTWPRPSGMSLWTSGQTLAVKITAVPVITIEAVTTTVEYGGNSNAAESVAEFKFTRYGSTDERAELRPASRWCNRRRGPRRYEVQCRAIEFQQLSLGRRRGHQRQSAVQHYVDRALVASTTSRAPHKLRQ